MNFCHSPERKKIMEYHWEVGVPRLRVCVLGRGEGSDGCWGNFLGWSCSVGFWSLPEVIARNETI